MPDGNLGTLYYSIEADTSKLVNSTPAVEQALKQVEKDLNKLDKSFDGVEKGAGKAGRAIRDVGDKGKEAGNKMKPLPVAIQNIGKSATSAIPGMSRLVPFLAGLATINTAQNIIKIADAWTDFQNRLRLVTKSQDDLAKATDDVFRIAQSTSQSIDPVAEVYQRFAQNADTLGLSLDEVAQVTDTVAKAVAVSGASATAAQAALTQFGQALASGTLRGEELNSVMEQTPGLAKAIADGLNIPIGQLRTLAADGKITAQALIGALQNASAGVNEQFATRIKTVDQAWTELTNSIRRYIGEAGSATGLTTDLANAISSISQSISNADLDGFAREIEGIRTTISGVQDGVSAFVDTFKERLNEIPPLVGGPIIDVMKTFFGTVETGSEESTKRMNSSFADMVLSTAKEIDGLSEVFTGAVGSIQGMWEALTTNIPNLFKNAWSSVLSGAASFVNSLGDLINKPLAALGMETVGKVSWGDGGGGNKIVSIADAARKGWDAAKKSAGAYDYVVGKMSNRMIDQAAVDTINEYNRATDNATKKTTAAAAATDKKAGSSRKASAAEREAVQAAKANQKVIDDLAQSLMLAGIHGEELAVAKAKMALNPAATPQEVAAAEALARALYQATQAQKNAALLSSVDDFAAENTGFEKKLADLKTLNEAKLLEDQRYLELKYQAEVSHDQAIRALQEENFRRQSVWNDVLMTSLDRVGQTGANAFVDIATGAASGSDAVRALAQAVITDVVNAFISMGIAQVKAWIMGRTAQATAAAAYVASVSGQVAANTALAAQGAFAATAAIPYVGPILAPAAAVAAGTAAASLGAPAIAAATATLAGGRQYGGDVAAGKMYRVNEGGKPEILNMGNGKQYLLPNSRGEVVSNKDATGSNGATTGGTIVNVIENPNKAGQTEKRMVGDNEEVNVFVADIRGGGSRADALEQTYGLTRVGR